MVRMRWKIDVGGTVQGIGFRPFVYKEALRCSLTGYVWNHSNGVTIEAEGDITNLEQFAKTVEESPPPFAEIHTFSKSNIETQDDTEFKIIQSENLGKAGTLISADIATCADCLNDIQDPDNRRYGYPFTNCTNCGPRYTIIEGVPYDRPKTAMKGFEMCPECLKEYTDPLDRRYHAQPNCCPACGPKLSLITIDPSNSHRHCESEGRSNLQQELVDGGLRRSSLSRNDDRVSETIDLLSEEKIVAIKGLGGFHLACDALNEKAVCKLRERKMRDEKPFALMMPDVETVRHYCEMSDEEEAILSSPQRPIVILRKRDEGRGTRNEGRSIAESVAPNNCYLGVMLPYTPLHHLLFKTEELKHRGTEALVMTSANLTDEPICYENVDAQQRLKDVADAFLIHNRDIYIRTDDSITRVMNGRPMMLRRARGYTPQPILLEPRHRGTKAQILAVGPELKNTICLLKENKAFLSQHIGDLENTKSYDSFEKSITHIEELFDIKPTVIAHDLHPNYFSTEWALNCSTEELKNCRTMAIQHHHAHIASCMAENRIDGPVIGIALDGTGYGTDGAIWGGEFLVANFDRFERVGQFEYRPLPGGDAAIKHPWQTALSYISVSVPQCSSASVVKDLIPAFRNMDDDKIDLVLTMIDKKINSPLTSSCGRLFDAVAAIIGLKKDVSFEGQAAMELEMLAARAKDSPVEPYSYSIDNNDYITISYKDTIKGILEDLKGGKEAPEIAWRFHQTLIQALTEATILIRQRTQIEKAALSGGCFQNILLTENLKKSLEAAGFTVYTHSLVPPNDGGLSLGQVVIANAITNTSETPKDQHPKPKEE